MRDSSVLSMRCPLRPGHKRAPEKSKEPKGKIMNGLEGTSLMRLYVEDGGLSSQKKKTREKKEAALKSMRKPLGR